MRCNLSQQHRHAILRSDHYILKILYAGRAPKAANGVLLFVVLNESASKVLVVAGNLLHHVVNSQVETPQGDRFHFDRHIVLCNHPRS